MIKCKKEDTEIFGVLFFATNSMSHRSVYCLQVMYMVVYLDSVFILNTIINYFLLRLTGRLYGASIQRWRYALAAGIGGCYAVSVFFVEDGWLGETLVKLALGVFLCLVAFGSERELWKISVLFLALSCVLAGGVLALSMFTGHSFLQKGVFYFDADWKVFVITAVLVYGLLQLLFGRAVSHGVHGELVKVRLTHRSREVTLRALCDTGNTLRDPITGQKVMVVHAAALGPLWPREMQRLFAASDWTAVDMMEKLQPYRGEFRFSLLPYSAVGVEEGMLLMMRCERAEIDGKVCRHLPVALSRTPLNKEGSYDALWGRNG